MARHALITQVYGCFLSLSHYCILMERVRGVDLQKLMKSSTALSEAVSAVVLAQLCLAVEYLHYVGFIHRNLCTPPEAQIWYSSLFKVENVMITSMCRVRVVDFAHLKACSGMYSVRMLQTYRKRTIKEFNDRDVVGPLPYRAPELLRRQAYGRAIDWWAVGVIAYVMKFGKLPFRGDTEADVITEILNGNINAKLGDQGKFREQGRASTPRSSTKESEKLYNELVQRLLRVRVTSRLCSETYGDYRQHAFFELLNWEALERSEEIMPVPLVTEILENSPPIEVKESSTSMKASPICISFDSLQNCSKQFALFTFNSHGFMKAQEAYRSVGTVTAEMLDEPVELIGSFRDNEPYKFQDWYKSTRL
ncbi:microtubule-associated serine/threonine-protein kinase 3-like [Galendromus occidentalis]|uniref:Serine/threonine-protein kinase greatwall n=1 Tax=Galendromus occidentalis TaxID=34638 RepID=A0AAJ6QQ93_9ACAR|nr:microtubule-associated serine/threonine-protein kinase 3-like [Galendromus occidentalis]